MTARLRLLLGGEWIAETTDYSIDTKHKIAILPISKFKSGSLVGTNSTLYDLQGGDKLSPRGAMKLDNKEDADQAEVNLSLVDAWQEVELPYANPFAADKHQVVVLPSARLVTISYNGKQVASTTSAFLCFEIGQKAYPLRIYIPNADVDMKDLTRTDTKTHCPFKGNARYYSVFEEKDLAWYYLTPDERACKDLHNTICFYTDKPGFGTSIDNGDIPYPREGFGYTA